MDGPRRPSQFHLEAYPELKGDDGTLWALSRHTARQCQGPSTPGEEASEPTFSLRHYKRRACSKTPRSNRQTIL